MKTITEAKIELVKALVRQDVEFLCNEDRMLLGLLSTDPDIKRWQNKLKRNEMGKN